MTDVLDVLKAGLARLRTSEEFSDCTIVCGPYQFKVHKCVLSMHSEYFSKAFQVGAFKEGRSSQLELKATPSDSDDADDACDDPDIVKLMIHYFYHLDYLNEPSEDADMEASATDAHLIEHAKAFAMAVKYQAGGLRALASAKFKTSVANNWAHEDFARAINTVYTSSPDDVTELRTIAADAVHKHEQYFIDIPEVQSLARSLPSFAYDLLQRSRGRLDELPELIVPCANCGQCATFPGTTGFLFCDRCVKCVVQCGTCYSDNNRCQNCDSVLVWRV